MWQNQNGLISSHCVHRLRPKLQPLRRMKMTKRATLRSLKRPRRRRYHRLALHTPLPTSLARARWLVMRTLVPQLLPACLHAWLSSGDVATVVYWTMCGCTIWTRPRGSSNGWVDCGLEKGSHAHNPFRAAMWWVLTHLSDVG